MTRQLRRVYAYFVLPIAVAALAAACSQNGSPESPSSSSSSSGATIMGQISSGSSTAERAAETTSNLKVTVAGTNLSTQVQGNGQFTLENVPPGDATLVFTGSGTDATLTISGLSEGERVQIVVSVSGSHASLESQQSSQPDGQDTEIEGLISSIDLAAGTIVVDGKTISVPAAATIRHGNTTVAFADLKVGQRVHVKGTPQGTQFVATEVIVQNENTSPGNGGGD